MTLETVMTMLLYMAAGWIALVAVKMLQSWWEGGRPDHLVTGLIGVVAATIAIAYLTWWPLLLALTWQWIAPFVYRAAKD
jgi:hypothetical protein